ncbi:alpha/beta hydrolase [Curtobacterium sp. MCPF17_011]|uniref:alpha/beta fold hydrolase n=1 Tax=unclassified Curtobacterium TaxID=257496 RepID=UPI000D880F15|nr:MULTISPECIES: alpha/beta hydrolase [unclassified Curtobacterium]PYY34350.1 alpha/beta hydrolase [Curtobacterium sp. MCBD17_030]PZF15395.1 alpha/beta hydrolase [Curtobacterium sp. MCPF17_011]
MTTTADRSVLSADGTRIAVSSSGDGPALVVVGGAFDHRGTPFVDGVVAAFSDRYRVVTYDRRGRGASGDTRPWSVTREIEDLAAVVADVGAPVDLLGICVGAAVVLHAVATGVPVGRAVLYEPPYRASVDAHADDVLFADRLDEMIAGGRRAAAVRAYLTRVLGVPMLQVSAVPLKPKLWKALLADAGVLGRDVRVLSGLVVPERALAAVGIPVLVAAGTSGPTWTRAAARAVVETVPGSTSVVLEGQGHVPDPAVLRSTVDDFLQAQPSPDPH